MGRRLGIAMILLLTLLVAADRGGQFLIERVVAGKLQDSFRSSAEPGVDIAGIPFLDQVITRDFDKITLSVRDADAGGVRVARIDAKLKNVRQEGGGARVGTVTGDGLITYDALTTAARGFRVSYGGDGLIKVTRTVAGVDASASARPRIVGQELIIKPERVSSSVTGELATGGLPTINVKLRDIPENLRIDLDPSERGVRFEFSGTNVLFVASGQASSLGPPRAPVLGVVPARPVGGAAAPLPR
jgi:hypothetical protein